LGVEGAVCTGDNLSKGDLVEAWYDGEDLGGEVVLYDESLCEGY
jgi:hypothetical protein